MNENKPRNVLQVFFHQLLHSKWHNCLAAQMHASMFSRMSALQWRSATKAQTYTGMPWRCASGVQTYGKTWRHAFVLLNSGATLNEEVDGRILVKRFLVYFHS